MHTIKLKESHRAWFVWGTPEAADRCRQAKRRSAWVVVEAKTRPRGLIHWSPMLISKDISTTQGRRKATSIYEVFQAVIFSQGPIFGANTLPSGSSCLCLYGFAGPFSLCCWMLIINIITVLTVTVTVLEHLSCWLICKIIKYLRQNWTWNFHRHPHWLRLCFPARPYKKPISIFEIQFIPLPSLFNSLSTFWKTDLSCYWLLWSVKNNMRLMKRVVSGG